MEEALGRMPKVDEFGASEFEYRSTVLSSDPEQAWLKYAGVAETAREAFLRSPQDGSDRPS